MARPLRIVCYAVNGSGLGHVTRLLAIARWLRRLETMLSGVAPEVIFLTSTEATNLLADARMAAFKLPSKGVARQSGLDVLEHRRLAKHFVWQTLGVLAPDLLLVDTFPQGSFDELLPVLDGPFKKVLVLRDVKPEFGARPIFQAAMRLYDRIIVPHVPGSAPELARVLGPERHAAWVGDVLAVEAAESGEAGKGGRAGAGAAADALRAELGLVPAGPGAPRLVYLSAGGGGDAGSEAALGALAAPFIGRPDVHALVGAGPLYRGRRLVGANLTWFTEPGVSRFFPALDAALAAGGYNTVHELLHLGVPSAFFAQDKIADQQGERVRRASAAGAALALTGLDAATLDAALVELLRDGARMAAAARAFVPDNGARFAAAQALAVLPGRDAELALGAAELLGPRLAAALERLGPVGAELLASGLAQLDPSPRLSATSARQAIEPLLPQLSAAARAEVTEALRARVSDDGRRAVQEAVIDLIGAAEDAGEAGLLPGLLEAALRKHPAAQEPRHGANPDAAAWAVGLVTALTALVRMPGPFTVSERAQLYRAFPRLADASLAEAMAAFREALAACAGEPVEALLARFRILKLQRRVVRASLPATLMAAKS